MAMSLRRAFNKRMMSPLTRYIVPAGYYDDTNEYIIPSPTAEVIWGVITVGNKFSQFDVGIALKATEGGERFSDFRTLYVTDKYFIDIKDKIGYAHEYFNVIQMSPEDTFGFRGYLLEKDKTWTPHE